MMIGEGATGKVFLGKCRETLMDVAVKIIHEKVVVCFVVCGVSWILVLWVLVLWMGEKKKKEKGERK